MAAASPLAGKAAGLASLASASPLAGKLPGFLQRGGGGGSGTLEHLESMISEKQKEFSSSSDVFIIGLLVLLSAVGFTLSSLRSNGDLKITGADKQDGPSGNTGTV
jgi:hypothetical protein